MAIAKQHIDASLVLKFLQEKFDTSSAHADPINEGETSAAFFFSANGKDYVIRIGGNLDHFEKDKFAYEHFASSRLPISEVLALGHFQKDLFYIISEKVEGNLFFTFKEEKALLPHFIATLDEIHATDISQYSGYGGWENDGNAFHASWKACLESINNEEYFHWSRIFKETFLKKETFDKLYDKLLSLLKFCPEDRYLIHGDFGVNNVLAKGEKVTGVLDWGLSKYGDFLYDVAWIDFWPGQTNFGEVFLEHYKEKGVNVNHFQERLLCYKMHFTLGTLHFAATSNNKNMYDYTLDRILDQIKKAGI